MIVGLSIFLLPQLLLSALMVLLSLLDPKMAAFWKDFESIQHSIARYSNGTFWEVMQRRWADWTTANSPETSYIYFVNDTADDDDWSRSK